MFDQLITGFTNFASSFMDSPMVSDAVNGALFGAVTTAIGGGDIAEGAAWGAAGGALSGTGDDGIFGSFTNEIGGAVSGYGIDKALGGDGLIGAAAGAAYKYFGEDDSTAQPAQTKGDSAEVEGEFTGASGTGSWGETPSGSGGEIGLLEKLALQTESGEGTMLGKALLGAAKNYGASRAREDAMDHESKLIKEQKEHGKELDERFEQRDLRAFKGPSMVIRNG